jgi:hypothetical protein
MEAMNTMVARVPLRAQQSGHRVDSEDFPFCGIFPHGKRGVFTREECSALGRVSVALLNCIDPFHHSVQLCSEPALCESENSTESDLRIESALTDLSMNPTFGTVRGTSVGIRRRREQVMSGAPSSTNIFRVVEELAELSDIALDPRSAILDPVYLSLRPRSFRDAVATKVSAMRGD